IGLDPASRLEIDAVQLQVSAAGSNAYIADVADGVRMHDSTVGPANTFDLLVIDGNLTSVVGGPRDIGAGTLVLEVQNGTIGTGAASRLEISTIIALYANANGGNIFLRETDGDLPVALVG